MGEWECMDCGYKFKLSTSHTISKKVSSRERVLVRRLVMIAAVLVVSPWLLILLIPLFPYEIRLPIGGVVAILLIASGLYILLLILYAILRLAFKK